MIKRIFLYIVGYSVFGADADNAAGFLTCLVKSGVAESMPTTVNGYVSVRVAKKNKRLLSSMLDRAGVRYEITRESGIVPFIVAHIDRVGLTVGVVLSALIISLSSNHVWGITVSGNEKVSDSEIIAILEESGFGIGTDYTKIDFDQFQNDILLTTDKLAWISINMNGSKAEVEVIERDTADKPHYDTECSNLVASEDGIVEYISEVEGQAVVKLGEFVRKGDVLISGVRANKNGKLTYTNAEGKVKARVTRVISVRVGREKAVKRYTGNETTERKIKIFSKTINLFGNGSNLTTEYDIIVRDRQIVPFGSFPTPIFVCDTVYREYVTEPYTMTDEEMIAESKRQYAERLKETVGDGALLSVDYKSGYDGDEYVITATAVVLDEITARTEVQIYG